LSERVAFLGERVGGGGGRTQFTLRDSALFNSIHTLPAAGSSFQEHSHRARTAHGQARSVPGPRAQRRAPCERPAPLPLRYISAETTAWATTAANPKSIKCGHARFLVTRRSKEGRAATPGAGRLRLSSAAKLIQHRLRRRPLRRRGRRHRLAIAAMWHHPRHPRHPVHHSHRREGRRRRSHP